MFKDFDGNLELARNGIAFILPSYGGYTYGHRTALSFFRYTPEELHPVVLHYDDASVEYGQQNWDYFYSDLPKERIWHRRFMQNGGLTRSWNSGLSLASQLGCKYAITGNSDLLFSPGWSDGLRRQLDLGVHLIGPLTNAPGKTYGGARQGITNYIKGYLPNDSAEAIARTAAELRERFINPSLVACDINGFFMMAKCSTWATGAFDAYNVFNPKYKMRGNEDELEKRWHKLGYTIGVALDSFILHYRSVTRGERFITDGALRLTDPHKAV